MANHMKTTVDIAEPLLKQAKMLARKENITVRALLERGLKLVLAEYKDRKEFKLRDASVSGKGLHAESADVSWAQIRSKIYETRGG